MIVNFKNKGYSTADYAEAKIRKFVPDDVRSFVAVQNGKFYPVVVLRADQVYRARAFAESGFYVIG